MKESEYLKQIYSEISMYFEEKSKKSDISGWPKKLKEYASKCGLPPLDVGGMDETEALIATAYQLDGWIRSRLDLVKSNRLKRYPDGTIFSQVFKEVPAKTKKEKAKK